MDSGIAGGRTDEVLRVPSLGTDRLQPRSGGAPGVVWASGTQWLLSISSEIRPTCTPLLHLPLANNGGQSKAKLNSLLCAAPSSERCREPLPTNHLRTELAEGMTERCPASGNVALRALRQSGGVCTTRKAVYGHNRYIGASSRSPSKSE